VVDYGGGFKVFESEVRGQMIDGSKLDMLPRSRLCSSLMISKLFYFLCFIPPSKYLVGFCIFHCIYFLGEYYSHPPPK